MNFSPSYNYIQNGGEGGNRVNFYLISLLGKYMKECLHKRIITRYYFKVKFPQFVFLFFPDATARNEENISAMEIKEVSEEHNA